MFSYERELPKNEEDLVIMKRWGMANTQKKMSQDRTEEETRTAEKEKKIKENMETATKRRLKRGDWMEEIK